eukprot:GFKZ01012130.1.p1 GENE.GFKZ01012130.1~~GFKZ01012130.1.p1  ORF type:complete len:365 (+),score=97.73 GFKZ01012130.1:85-1095(+)
MSGKLAPGPTTTRMRLEDDTWLKSVLNLIPKTIYCGGPHDSLAPVSRKDAKSLKGKKKQNNKGEKKQKKKPALSLGNEAPERKGLREKLHQKIIEKRVARKADDETRIAIRAHRKRKREETEALKEKEAKKMRREKKFDKLKNEKEQKKREQKEANPETDKIEHDEKQSLVKESPSDGGVDTARVVGFSEEKEKKKKGKRRKLGGDKLRELQKKLLEAKKDQDLKEKAIGGVSEGKRSVDKDAAMEEVLDKEMDKALQRVQGEEVKDDVKRLKKSIRREKRKSEKSKEEWAKRVEAVEKEKAAKQERREKNLKERKENKAKGSHSKPKKKISKRRK